MKIYVYKMLIFFGLIFFLYHLTIGHTIYKFQNKFYSLLDKKSADIIKEKIRTELKSSLKKDKILNEEDALLLNRIFKKLNSEIKNAK